MPWKNQNCTECVANTYFYVDYRKLGIVANGSCWEDCPDTTYNNGTNMTCLDCGDYCICDEADPTICLSCVNDTFIFDKDKNACYKSCPDRTTYVKSSASCEPCSELCDSCSGTTTNDCLTCIASYELYEAAPSYCVTKLCEHGYYLDKWGTRECEPCDESCSSCVGPGVSNCTSCTDGFICYPFGAKKCQCYDCAKISKVDSRYTDTYDSDINGCVEVCGDGYNLGQFECDDGNIKDKDGCDHECSVELNWKCIGGSSKSKDKCSYIGPITTYSSIKSQGSGIGYIDVWFSMDVISIYPNLNSSQITLSVNGKYGPYSYTYNV